MKTLNNIKEKYKEYRTGDISVFLDYLANSEPFEKSEMSEISDFLGKSLSISEAFDFCLRSEKNDKKND